MKKTSEKIGTLSAAGASDLQKKVVANTTFHANLAERVVSISESKIRLCLMKYLQNMKDRTAWHTPFGIGLTIVITLITTDFKPHIFTADTWQAIFIISGILCSVWFIKILAGMSKKISVDNVIDELIPPK